MTCKECRHWGGNSPTRAQHDSKQPMMYWLMLCERISKSPPSSGAFGDWGIVTGPDFGCVHWEDHHGNKTSEKCGCLKVIGRIVLADGRVMELIQ